MMQAETCAFPECETTEIALHIGPRREPYCMEHIDYGTGRVFGPIHAILDAMSKEGIGVCSPSPDSQEGTSHCGECEERGAQNATPCPHCGQLLDEPYDLWLGCPKCGADSQEGA